MYICTYLTEFLQNYGESNENELLSDSVESGNFEILHCHAVIKYFKCKIYSYSLEKNVIHKVTKTIFFSVISTFLLNSY